MRGSLVFTLIRSLLDFIFNKAHNAGYTVPGYDDYYPEPEADRDMEILNENYYKTLQTQFPDRTAEIEGIINGHDPDFSSGEFLPYAREVFNGIETALSENNMESVKHYFKEELFNVMSRKRRADFIEGKQYMKYLEADKLYITSYKMNGESGEETAAVYLTVKRIEWQKLGQAEKMSGKDVEAKTDSRYRLKFTRTGGGNWLLSAHEPIKYHTADEGVVIIK